MKPGSPSLTSTRLLDQLRERIRYLHYSLQTEKAYLYWTRFFIRWHGRGGVMRWVFGSVADKVLRNAVVPILLARVPPRQNVEVAEPAAQRVPAD